MNDLEQPVIYPITTIQPNDPEKYSVAMGNFIQPDFINIPSSVTSGLSMFTYMEVPRHTGSPSYIKGCFFRKTEFTEPMSLAIKNNNPRSIADSLNVGDYCYGGFFWYNKKYNFVTQWPEADGIHCSIISADPNLKPALTIKH